jgi:hypothetical protein
VLRRDPLRAIGRQAARRDEEMDVRMVEHRRVHVWRTARQPRRAPT